MKLSAEDLNLLIPIVGWVVGQCSPARDAAEQALLAKLRRMQACLKEETNELEASEN
jgi:hypothetical protein